MNDDKMNGIFSKMVLMKCMTNDDRCSMIPRLCAMELHVVVGDPNNPAGTWLCHIHPKLIAPTDLDDLRTHCWPEVVYHPPTGPFIHAEALMMMMSEPPSYT